MLCINIILSPCTNKCYLILPANLTAQYLRPSLPRTLLSNPRACAVVPDSGFLRWPSISLDTGIMPSCKRQIYDPTSGNGRVVARLADPLFRTLPA